MKLILKDEYMSLKPFESDKLNDLTIITGKNGSGKTQLLDLIAKKAKNDGSLNTIRIEFQPVINKIQSEGIIKNATKQITHAEWKKIVQQQLNKFNQLPKEVVNLIKYLKVNYSIKTIFNYHTLNTLLSNDDEYKDLIATVFSKYNNSPRLPINNINNDIQQEVFRYVFNNNNLQLFKLLEEICTYTGKEVDEISDANFFNTPIKEYLIDNNDLFSSEIELIFYNYAKRREDNRIAYFYKKEDKKNINAVSDEEFISINLPPWEVINSILNQHKIDFTFSGIDRGEFTIETPFKFNLTKKSIDKEIKFNDLSSGEKVIMGLILKLFTSTYYGDNLTFPELIVLDEPDAYLHPEMTKLLIDVLQDTFVNKYNIKVILTTHSPSTIALAPENSVYQLRNGKESALKKISKNEALVLLTNFIPTLSIDYKNHKQVFVESPTDVFYYQHIYDKHNQNKKLPNKLYFISNSNGKSNCIQVYNIVDEIRKSGNSTSFGIVDWDLKNNPKEYIKVHGYKNRYSLENIILDPIYVLSLLIEMKNAHNICQNIYIDITYNQYLIGNEPNERLQTFVRYFFAQFEIKFPVLKYNTKKELIKYYNGREVEIPEWYLKMNGHEIVDKVKNVFPALNQFMREGELQNSLSILIAKCYPFVPMDTIKVLESI